MRFCVLQHLPKFRTSLSPRYALLTWSGVSPGYLLPFAGRNMMSSSSRKSTCDSIAHSLGMKPGVVEDGEYVAYVMAQEKKAGKGPLSRLPEPEEAEEPEINLKECWKTAYKEIISSLEAYNMKPGAPWGLVVYRAAYGPGTDEPWKQILKEIQNAYGLSPEHLKEPEKVLPFYRLTVMEDEKRFSGADPYTISHAFREWVANDLPPRLANPERYGGIKELKNKIRKNNYSIEEYAINPCFFAPPRWNFCLLVDDRCLLSVETKSTWTPVVKIVNIDVPERCENIAEGWEDGETDDHEENVGWMYITAKRHVEWYDLLVQPGFWWENAYYARPEKMDCPMAFDEWGSA